MKKEDVSVLLFMLILAMAFAGPAMVLAYSTAKTTQEAVKACYASGKADCEKLLR